MSVLAREREREREREAGEWGGNGEVVVSDLSETMSVYCA